MFKITENIDEIHQINAKQSLIEDGTIYCEINAHCLQNKYAIPLITDILKSYNIQFINDEWLSTNIVDTLPSDWNWYAIERTYRLCVPGKLLSNDIIKQLIIKVIENELPTQSDDTTHYIYFNDLDGDDYILEMFPEIKKEERDAKNKVKSISDSIK